VQHHTWLWYSLTAEGNVFNVEFLFFLCIVHSFSKVDEANINENTKRNNIKILWETASGGSHL
jgi:hypothetical protein